MKELYHISVLGDSISTFEGCTPLGGVYYGPTFGDITGVYTPEDTWWMQVIRAMGGQLLANNSWSGSTVSTVGGIPACSLSRIRKLAVDGQAPDQILILAGLNDVNLFADPQLFASDYRLMLQRIRETYPQAAVTCGTFTSGYLSDTPFTQQIGPMRDRLAPYNQAIRAAVAEAGVQLADIAQLDQRYASMDGLHPNGEGMKQLARFWLETTEATLLK